MKKIIILLSLVGLMTLFSGCSIKETWDVLWGHNEKKDEQTDVQTTYDPNAIQVDESVTAPKFTKDLEGSRTYAVNEEAKPIEVEAAEEAEGEVTYQWYVNTVDSNGGGEQIIGATENAYIPDTSKDGRFYYFAVATHTVDNKMNLSTSKIMEIIVDPEALPAEEAKKQPGWVETEEGHIYNDEEGKPKKGWIQDGDKWYFTGEDGLMKTGWVQDDNKWYVLGEKGDMQTGWYKDDDKWYYLGDNGIMQTGFVVDGGKKYCLTQDGIMKTSAWTEHDNKWFYSKEDGSLAIGWEELKGSWYYFSPEGVMRYDTEIEGKWLNPDGRLAE